MLWLGLGLLALLGLAVGSFLNVVIYRIPAGRSIVSPASACPHCGHAIVWYDNIPVLSWLVLRAKCRNCAEPISARYPLVELATGILFAGVGLAFLPPILAATTAASLIGGLLALVAYLYLAAVSVTLAMIDLDTHRLPNVITYPAYIVMVVLLTASSVLVGEPGLIGQAAIGGASLLALYFIAAMVYPGGMGFGDVKLSGVLGLSMAWIGWGEFAVGAFAPFVLGGLFSIALIILHRAGRKTGIPFGPWMLLGAWIGIFIGGEVFDWYLGLFGLS